MAKVTTTTDIDDLDGSPAEQLNIFFALDKGRYRIDLSNDNAEKLRAALAPFIAAARIDKAGQPVAPKPARGAQSAQRAEHAEYLARVRQWAAEHGIEVKGRGRVPVEVLRAYAEEHAGQAA